MSLRALFIRQAWAGYDRLIALAARARPATYLLMLLAIPPAVLSIVPRRWNDRRGLLAQARAWGWRGSPVSLLLSHALAFALHRLCGDLLYAAPWRWNEFVVTRNLNAITDTLARGRGVVVLGSHTGPWLSPLLFHRHGIPAATYSLAANVKKSRQPRDSNAAQRFLAAYPFIPTGQERRLFKQLGMPGVVVIYDDVVLPPSKRSLPVDIRGVTGHFSTLPFELGADVVLMTTRRIGFARYSMVFEALPADLSKREAMDRYVAMLEAEIEHDVPSCVTLLFPQFKEKPSR